MRVGSLREDNYTRFEYHFRSRAKVFRFPEDEISECAYGDVTYEMTNTMCNSTIDERYDKRVSYEISLLKKTTRATYGLTVYLAM